MGTLSVDAKDVGKGERLSHDTVIQWLSNPLERAWVRGKKLVLPLAKQILNVSKKVVESATFVHTIELKNLYYYYYYYLLIYLI